MLHICNSSIPKGLVLGQFLPLISHVTNPYEAVKDDVTSAV